QAAQAADAVDLPEAGDHLHGGGHQGAPERLRELVVGRQQDERLTFHGPPLPVLWTQAVAEQSLGRCRCTNLANRALGAAYARGSHVESATRLGFGEIAVND